MSFVRVALPLGVEGTFTYRVPESLHDVVGPGMRLLVPWGPKLATAFALELLRESDVPAAKMRDVADVLDDDPAITSQILELSAWAADYYLAPIGEMLRIVLPANMSATSKREVRVLASANEISEGVSAGELNDAALDFLSALPETKPSQLPRLLAKNRALLRDLVERGIVEVDERLTDKAGVRMDRYVVLESPPQLLPAKQQNVVDLLEQAKGELSYAALIDAGASGSAIATLVRKGVLRIHKKRRSASLGGHIARVPDTPLKLTEEQRNAVEQVYAAFGTFKPFLLQGVTGSGKTEVYIELLSRAVREGKQGILLVPEISLTPAAAGRLRAQFGERIAILHSNLTPGEKYDQWKRARDGEVDVAIGPRSALFTPFERLGIIIVDEEGDAAYKQEETPRYNARDLAVVRGRIADVPVLLGSATPSLETRENAERGRYGFLPMAKRVEARPLPDVEIVDLRRERGEREDRGMIIFSGRLVEELRRIIDAGEQAMILMNRRGYAPYLLCRECENDFHCRDCSVTLTVHRKVGLLICHYCGFRRPIPAKCPQCQGEVLQPIGFGTEKVEERFRKLFPDVPVEVVDRDSTRRKGELVRILDRFRAGETRVLIGTQMISKGHDFPNVTFTGVINADAVLGYPDFRSAEKTFYLLTQVAGRAGRGEKPGKVLVQSAFPQHYAIQLAAKHDYDEFFKQEIEFRRRFNYPPFSGMVAVVVRGEELTEVEKAADRIGSRIEKEAKSVPDIRIQGPAPAPLSRIKGVHRFQILVRSRNRNALRRLVATAVDGQGGKGVEVVVDVDPINIL